MTIVVTNESDNIQFLPDYCPRCNPFGYHADSRVRLASLTEPTSVTWHGGKRVICEYRCVGCGHNWRRADLWTAQEAGFDPR
jgi:ribosomal protein L44E